ncbi:hypothetical protein PPERSA_12339 [Pseudocohnilembus persalinus]|uniref:Uncharacterized protein n=1 Tax=Pseudocohnilembus persalinus TaxID=266149 RepID=A0A0V0R1Y5_PSEPJ|nr:hypothetical protein PPERSA_12339 [Pseudocohnilembus persalinus]|eukprot:KRX08184.1 hypothetical protein PPERSA_12339 [Pseudocohnilembus persalinus]
MKQYIIGFIIGIIIAILGSLAIFQQNNKNSNSVQLFQKHGKTNPQLRTENSINNIISQQNEKNLEIIQQSNQNFIQNESGNVILKGQFYSMKNFPVSQTNVTLQVQGTQIQVQETDSTGFYHFKFNAINEFKQKNIDSVLCVIKLNVGNEIIGSYSYTLTKEITEVKSTVIDFGIKIIPSRKIQTTQLQGCVIDNDKKPIVGANVTVTYQTSIVLDIQSQLTDNQGCFILKNELTYFDVIIGIIEIYKQNYIQYTSKNDPQFKNTYGGAPLQIDYKYTLKTPIQMEIHYAQLNLNYLIQDQYNQPLQNINIFLYILSKDETIRANDTAITGKNGIYTYYDKIIYRDQYTVQLQTYTNNLDNSLYTFSISPNKNDSNLFERNSTITLTPRLFHGYIQGSVTNAHKQSLQYAFIDLQLEIENENKLFHKRSQVDKNGFFKISFDAYEGEKYQGNYTITAQGYQTYQSKNLELTLNQNQFRISNQNITLKGQGC